MISKLRAAGQIGVDESFTLVRVGWAYFCGQKLLPLGCAVGAAEGCDLLIFRFGLN